MTLRHIPRMPERLRETPRILPNEIRLRSYRTSWEAARYVVEARAGGRVLGDKDFADYADAQELVEMERRWHSAKLVDEVARKRA